MECSEDCDDATVVAGCPCDPDGPATGPSSVCTRLGGLDADGGGASKGTTGDSGRGDGGAVGERPLRPAKMAGTGVEIATGNDGGGAKYPYPSSRSTSIFKGGVGGGRSAYDVSPSIPNRRDDQRTGVSGGLRSAFVTERDAGAAGEYGGGAVLMTVPGKYLGTNGVGPCIGGLSSDASVWKESLMEAASRCASV